MGKGYRRSSRTKITTKNAISKSELRNARKREESLINLSTSTVRTPNIKTEVPVKIEVTNTYTVENIIEDYKNGISIPELSSKYGITNELVLEAIIPYEYSENMLSVVEIVDKIGITNYQVRKILKATNTEMRPRGLGALKIKKEKEEAEMVSSENTIEEITTNEEDINIIKEDTKRVLSKNSFEFCGQNFIDSRLHLVEFDVHQNDIMVAGLCRDRHEIPMVTKYIYDTLTEKEFDNPHYLEERARGFINAYVKHAATAQAKTLVVYCTGLQLPLTALINICAQMRVNLVTMHWNPKTESYLPQNTLTIFGKVPDMSQMSPLRNMENRFDRGVYTYHCNIGELVAQEKCIAISINSDDTNSGIDSSSIVLFDKEFPDEEVWNIFGKLIKMSRDENLEIRKHNIQMNRIDVSLAGYRFKENICKSYNYAIEKRNYGDREYKTY